MQSPAGAPLQAEDRRHLQLFEARRSDIETFGRKLEAKDRASATIARRLCTISGFYRYAEEEGLITHSPAGMSADSGPTVSPMPSAWTATRSARSSSPPGSAPPLSTR